MSLRDAFLNALAENEDDIATRLVYSDWLDEQGEHEEADRQRQWPAAKAWLVKFCRDHNSEGGKESDWGFISYRELIELGRQAIAEATDWGPVIDCGANEEMCDALRASHRDFWQNWSIVTGIPVPPEQADNSHFGCSC